MVHACQPGILKRMATTARHTSSQSASGLQIDPTQAIWKLSMGEEPLDETLFHKAIRGGFITLGCGDGIDFSNCESREEIFAQLARGQPALSIGDQTVSALHYFRSGMQSNDLVVISDGPKHFRAIGRICGPYEHTNTELGGDRTQVRKVDWLAVLRTMHVFNLLRKTFMSATPGCEHIAWRAPEMGSES